MGFDNECIVNIQSLAGEYFCPVCRLLVYPNEALQAQCTHLYCKPCLTYVVGTTRACPYDGYLVTEADSKPLTESNKSLAETIGKIAVHCLYHRSGCQWQGPLSECSSHCSGCAFGNSPVVCNRCAIQIVHRQVQEHAQICPGVQPQTQPADGVQDAATPATSSNPHHMQTTNQLGASNSQAQASQAVAAPPSGQIPSTQVIASSQAMAVAPAPGPTPEQVYQQQYQQYYQQYTGYDPYQQAYHQYYQQQAIQQYQQQPPHVPVQHQSQVYSQPQAQGHIQPQAQVQPQTHSLPQTQPPHAQPQPIQHVQAPVAVQTSVNPQLQHNAAVQHPTQMQSQTHPPPHGHPQLQNQPQPYPIQPHSQQPMQMPQYQQPQSQFQHPQAQIPPQPQHQILPHQQSQPQAPLPHPHTHLQPPPQPNQPTAINAQPQAQYAQAHAVTGNQSYPQAPQQMQLGAQHPPHMHVQTGPISQHHVPMPGQFPPQPPQMRPPQSHVPVPNQQRPALLPPQGQFPNVPSVQQPIHPHVQQPSHPGQRPILPPNQQPLPQHVQQQQAFPVQTSAPVQSQLHLHGNLVQQQQVMQAQLRPQGPPHSMQQNFAPSHGLPPHQSQNYAARPVMQSGMQAQLIPQNPGFAGGAQVRPMQFSGNQSMTNQTYGPRTDNQMHMVSEQHIQSALTSKPSGADRQGDHMPVKSLADQNNGSPSQRSAQKEPNGSVSVSSLGTLSVEANNLKSETDLQKPMSGDEDNKIYADGHGKDSGSDLHAAGNGSSEPANKHLVKTEGDKSRLESSPGKSVETGAAELKDASGGPQRGENSTGGDASLMPPEASKDQNAKLQKDAGMVEPAGASGGDRLQYGSQERNLNQSHGPVPGKGFMPPPQPFPPSDQGRHQHMVMHYGPSNHQQAAPLPGPPYRTDVPGQPPNFIRPQGPSHLPTPGGIPGPSSIAFGQVPGHFSGPDRPFESHYNQSHVPPPHFGLARMSQGEPPGGIMGNPPPHGTEGQISQQRPHYLDGGRPDSQLVGFSDRAPFGQSHGMDSNAVRRKEGATIDSSAPVGFHGERFKHPTEEGLSRFPTEPAWRNDRGEFADDLKQFPRHSHFDNEPPSKFGNYHPSSRFNDRDPLVKAPHGANYDAGLQLDPGAGGPRFLPSYHPGGPNDARPVGPDGNIGRADSAHPDFLGPVPGFGRHHMDRPTPRSPGREYPGFPPRDFGGLSGFPRNQSGMDDIDGPHPFAGGPRTFNFPPDPTGNSFHENRFPLLPGHLRRGEFDGPDILPGHLRRGEFLGPRNLPVHSRFGEPTGFGGFTGHSRMGELDGPGNFPRHPPFGEPFGSNNSGHPRLGEPGFRSSYSATGGMDPFEHPRKRKSSTMGWCRICKVDCETVEGLDLHSQTRDHQKMAMDMVLTIKQQSKKRQKTSHDKSPAEEPSKLRVAGTEARGSKP